MYSKKMEQLWEDVGKLYYRNWENFNMIGLRKIVKDLEDGNYDETEYSKNDVKAICKYLCEFYFKQASICREHLEERRKQNMWI